MIGLGVGIDYGLFIVTQHRNQLAEGMDPPESAARATATAGGAVVFAGGTVIIALLSLLVAGIPIVTTLGYTSAIVVLIAVLAGITLLPAMLGLLGHAHPQRTALEGAAGRGAEGGRLAPLGARPSAGHPWMAIVESVAILLVLAIPVLSLTSARPTTARPRRARKTRESYDALTRGFGAGVNGPLLVAVRLSQPATNDQASLDKLKQKDQQQQQTVARGQGCAADAAAAGAAAAAREVPRHAKASDPAAADAPHRHAEARTTSSPSASRASTTRARPPSTRSSSEQRAVRRRDRRPREHAARHGPAEGHRRQGHDRIRRRIDRRATSTSPRRSRASCRR